MNSTCIELIIPTVLSTNLKEDITFQPAVYRPTILIDLKSKHKQIDLQLLDNQGGIITSKKLMPRLTKKYFLRMSTLLIYFALSSQAYFTLDNFSTTIFHF